MLVQFYVGSKTDVVTNNLKVQNDNVKITNYPTVDGMVSSAKIRNLVYDRIVVTSDFFGDNIYKGMQELNNYIQNYASNANVILILHSSKNDTDEDKQREMNSISSFKSIFNSLQYTPVSITHERQTLQVFNELINLDIGTIVARYWTQQDQNYFNIKLNRYKKDENSSNKIAEDTEDNEINEESSSSYVDESNSIDNEEDDYDFDEDDSDGSDDLSMGEEGEQHSDTAALDPDMDDMAELRANLARENAREQEQSEEYPDEGNQVEQNRYSPQEEYDDSNQDVQEQSQVSHVQVNTDNNVSVEKSNVESVSSKDDETSIYDTKLNGGLNIILGFSGKIRTLFSVDEAVRLTGKDKRVALVDLDFDNNGVLGYTNIELYLSVIGEGGITKGKPSQDDGVDVYSEGYKNVPEDNKINSLLRSCMNSYDATIVDTSFSAIKHIDINLLKQATIIVRCDSGIGAYTGITEALTDRTNVSLADEKTIMRNAKFSFNDYQDVKVEDLIYVNDNVMLVNGNWLLKLIS